MLKFGVGCTEEEILRDICELSVAAHPVELDLSKCLPQDIEFVIIKCIGKMCHISQTSPGFIWNGLAVKHLNICVNKAIFMFVLKEMSLSVMSPHLDLIVSFQMIIKYW